MAQAKAMMKRVKGIRATLPSAATWHRGAIIEGLTRLGQTSAMISGEHFEGDAFFRQISTRDLRSLLENHWLLKVMGGGSIDTEPPDVPDVPEPEFKPSSCRCECGYTCGRECGLDIMDCMEKHYVQDCDHDFTGPWEEYDDGHAGSVTCVHCGMSMMGHDIACGP